MYPKLSKDDSYIDENVRRDISGKGNIFQGSNVASRATGPQYGPFNQAHYNGSSAGYVPYSPAGRKYIVRDRQVIQDTSNVFMQRVRMGGISQTLSRPSEPPKPPRDSEPEHSEAFVEESGIKLFTPSNPNNTTHHLEDIEDNESDEEEDDEVVDDEDDDPLYELELGIMDDTIVEEGEDDEDDDDDEEDDDDDDDDKDDSITQVSEASMNDEVFIPDKVQNETKIPEPSPPPNHSSLTFQSKDTPQKLPESTTTVPQSSIEKSNSSSTSNSINSSNNSNNSMKNNSSNSISGQQEKLSEINKAIPLNKRDSHSSNSSRDSEIGDSAVNVATAGDLAGTIQAPVPVAEPFTRGRSGRMSLPLPRTSKPHKFTIKKVSESEAARRTNAFIDSRLGELRSPDLIQGRGPVPRPLPSPIWVKRHQETTISSGKGHQTGGVDPSTISDSGAGQDITPGHHGRPRSGTWSLANSRRAIIKSERDEEGRVRHKSGGDEIHADTSGTLAVGFGPIRKKDLNHGHTGFLDTFRPRSKSDAKAILQSSRQRRKSGDDVLNATKEKDKRKDPSPGFMDVFRQRSKSDAAQRNKKTTLISNMKNVFQHTLVSPGGSSTRGGRRSGEVTPVENSTNDDVYHTWHGVPTTKSRGGEGSRTPMKWVQDLFQTHKHRNETSEERIRRKSGGKHPGDRGLIRRHSVEPDKKKYNSSIYIRGEMDPNQRAELFRDSRGLPANDIFVQNISRQDLEENESQIYVKFFKYYKCYDLIPTSAKLVIFDTRLPVKKAFHALVSNGVRAAPLWDSKRQQFVGMLTITDFIRILQSFHNSHKMDDLENHRLETWRVILKDEDRPLISITPDEKLYVAIRSLIHHKIHRLPVIEPVTGNALYIITHKRILKFLYLYINYLPKPSILQKTLRELNLGTYDQIQTASEDTLIIEALNKFVEHRVSALPIVDKQGKLINIYAKFDVINLAAEGTYQNLNVTLRQANERRNEWFEGVQKCTMDETLSTIMERIVRAEVHRLVVIDSQERVIGIISLSDILKELVLKPCDDHEPGSLLRASLKQMEAAEETGEIGPDESTDTKTSSVDLTASNELQSEELNLEENMEKLHVEDNKQWNSDDQKNNQNEDDIKEVEKINNKTSPVDSEEDLGRYSNSSTEENLPVSSEEIIENR